MSEIIDRRTNYVIASLAENEALLEDLKTEDASALLDWGSACVRTIVLETNEVDDIVAESIMYPRLRSLRKMLRQINLLVSGRAGIDLLERDTLLGEVITQAGIVYGPSFPPPSFEQRVALLGALTEHPETWIASLRTCLETPPAA